MILFNEDEKHLNRKMISFDTLVESIENLHARGIIPFEEFKNLPYTEIKKRFFLMPAPKTIEKAIIKIIDKQRGYTGPSEYITQTETYREGKPTKIEIRREYF